MPMFLGCMSSKQAKSADGKKNKKSKANGGPVGPVQNGGQTQDEPAKKEPEAQQAAKELPPPPPQTDDVPAVSVSQIDVKENVPTSSGTRESESRQSFPARPATIVRDDSLIDEIETALNQSGGSRSLSSHHEAEESANISSDSLPPNPSPTLREAASEGDAEQSPPKRPPKPRLSEKSTPPPSLDRPPNPSDDSPPSLPPRTVPTEKISSSTSSAIFTTTTDATIENEGSEESPPVLPPRTVPTAPPKPRRCSLDSNTEDGLQITKAKPASFRKPPPPLPEDWAIIELPKTDAELHRLTPTPEQLASMTSKYVVKHISLHTDVRTTKELSEKIYANFLEVAKQHRSILQRFLTDLIEEQANSSEGDSQPTEPSHGAIIVMLREILKQFITPESVVMVSLDILLSVSRVSGATQALVECDVTSAVLGTMAAHKSSAGVQRYCLDVLAKIALFPSSLCTRLPLEQSAVDLVCLSLESFLKSLSMAQTACHVLDNMVTSLYSTANSTIDSDSDDLEEQDKFLSGLLALMDYVFSKSLPAVRSALKCHDQDMTIKSYGRQFLFIYAKLEQLKQRKRRRAKGIAASQSPPLSLPDHTALPLDQTSSASLPEQVERIDRRPSMESNSSPFTHSLEYENWDLLRGVLKKKSSLRDHSYSKADMMFMRQLTKTQVVALVCALAVDSHVQAALELLDQPMAKMLLTKEVPPGVRDFVAHQLTPTHTLIDLDPGLFVSLIDAVRYPSLSFKMAQNCVLEVASAMDGDQQVPVVAVTVEFLASTITNRPLAPAMTVPAFVDQVCGELERAKKVSQNGAALDSLLSEIRQCARKTGQH